MNKFILDNGAYISKSGFSTDALPRYFLILKIPVFVLKFESKAIIKVFKMFKFQQKGKLQIT